MSPSNGASRTDASARQISRYVRLRRDGAGAERVSLFTLDAGRSGDERLIARFARETALLAEARHPHLLRGAVGSGDTARVGEALMVFAPSDTDWLSTLSPHRRVLMFAQLASAVGALHRSGIVHGVLQPDRCGVRANGDLVLLDLGLVWRDEAGLGGGDDLGYCAPECRAGRGADARADLYSLGLLLYYFLSAKTPPRRGPSVLAHEFAALQPLLDALLSATPTQRPGSVTMLLDRLNATIMRTPALADLLESARQPGETPIERAIAVLSMQAQNAAFATPAAGEPHADATRWQLRRPAPGRVALRAGLALLAIAAAVAYGVHTRAPAERGLVESLAHTAQIQLDAGRLLLPADDNALDTLRTLRSVDPDGAATRTLAATLRAGAPAAVERAIAAQAFDDADAALSRSLRAFPDDAALAALSNRMAAVRRESEEREQRRERLLRLDEQLESGAVDDARLAALVEQVQKAQALAPGDADVAARRQRVETLLAERARAALAADDLAAAKNTVERLREGFPDAAVLASLDADYRQAAGVSRQQQSDELLRDAAAAEHGDLSRADAVEPVLDRYLAAARLVPGDAAANDGAVRIGRLARVRAEEALAAADWDAARRWLALARRALPAAETVALEQRIERHRRDEAAEREDLVARAELALRRGQYFGAGEGSAIALYRKSGDAASRQGIDRVRNAALKDVDTLIAQRRYDEAAALVDAALADLGKDADFGRRKLTLASLQESRATDLASAAQGTLSINAIPWATVQSVTAMSDGRAVALDSDATTPLRLSLPAGDYAIVLRDPAGSGTRLASVTVKAGGSASINVNLREAPPAAPGAAGSEP